MYVPAQDCGPYRYKIHLWNQAPRFMEHANLWQVQRMVQEGSPVPVWGPCGRLIQYQTSLCGLDFWVGETERWAEEDEPLPLSKLCPVCLQMLPRMRSYLVHEWLLPEFYRRGGIDWEVRTGAVADTEIPGGPHWGTAWECPDCGWRGEPTWLYKEALCYHCYAQMHRVDDRIQGCNVRRP